MMEEDVMTGIEFKLMVERMRPLLMRLGREFFGSDTEAEEVVQETWLRAWNVRERVVLTDAYVMRIARNCCVSMWRRQREEVELADGSSTAITKVTPEEELEEQENSEWLASRLQRLPKAEREVWQLFYEKGMTVEEIAEARSISVATVRNTISSVRNAPAHRLAPSLLHSAAVDSLRYYCAGNRNCCGSYPHTKFSFR